MKRHETTGRARRRGAVRAAALMLAAALTATMMAGAAGLPLENRKYAAETAGTGSSCGGSAAGESAAVTLSDEVTGVTVSGVFGGITALGVTAAPAHTACAACAYLSAVPARQRLALFSVTLSGTYAGALNVGIPVPAEYEGKTLSVLGSGADQKLTAYTAEVKSGRAGFTASAPAVFLVLNGTYALAPYSGSGYMTFDGREIPLQTGRYRDVKSGDWFSAAAANLSYLQLMQGVADDRFGPRLGATRGMLVTVLHRLEKQPVAIGTKPFTDVTAGTWCAAGAAWARSAGIVSGFADGSFRQNDPLTRAQLVTMLWRYARYRGVDTAAPASALSPFADGASLPKYAAEAFAWAVSIGLITGRADGTLAPGDGAARAETAVLLDRFMALCGPGTLILPAELLA